MQSAPTHKPLECHHKRYWEALADCATSQWHTRHDDAGAAGSESDDTDIRMNVDGRTTRSQADCNVAGVQQAPPSKRVCRHTTAQAIVPCDATAYHDTCMEEL